MQLTYRRLGPLTDLLLPMDMGAAWRWEARHIDRNDRFWHLEQRGGSDAYYAHHSGSVSRYLTIEDHYTAVWVDSGGYGNDVHEIGTFPTLAAAKRAVEVYQLRRCPRGAALLMCSFSS